MEFDHVMLKDISTPWQAKLQFSEQRVRLHLTVNVVTCCTALAILEHRVIIALPLAHHCCEG